MRGGFRAGAGRKRGQLNQDTTTMLRLAGSRGAYALSTVADDPTAPANARLAACRRLASKLFSRATLEHGPIKRLPGRAKADLEDRIEAAGTMDLLDALAAIAEDKSASKGVRLVAMRRLIGLVLARCLRADPRLR